MITESPGQVSLLSDNLFTVRLVLVFGSQIQSEDGMTRPIHMSPVVAVRPQDISVAEY